MLTKYEVYQAVQDSLNTSLPSIIRSVVEVNDRIKDLPDLSSRATIRKVIDISDHQFRKYEKKKMLNPVLPKETKSPLYHRHEILEIYIKERGWAMAK